MRNPTVYNNKMIKLIKSIKENLKQDLNFILEMNRNIYSFLITFCTLHTFNILWQHFIFSVRYDIGNKKQKDTPVHYQFLSPFIHHFASRLTLAGLPSTT
jgi:hypothetical protein